MFSVICVIKELPFLQIKATIIYTTKFLIDNHVEKLEILLLILGSCSLIENLATYSENFQTGDCPK